MQVGNYRLLAPLGHGGMGGVWEVEDGAGQRYALKSPAAGLASSEATKRFAREANALRVLDHPNLVAAVDVFVESGSLFLVMERVVGRTLAEILADGPLPVRRALVLVRQVLDGLGHAHAHGYVHRDLKPDNVMVVDMIGWERAKIVDFGLVKLIGDAAATLGGAELTTIGLVFGSPAYMSPEQALGKPIDGRSDIYAIGTMLFELLTGRVPFPEEDRMKQMMMQVKAPLPRLDQIMRQAPWCTPQLMALVEGALDKDPDRRFPNAQVMMAVLDDAFLSIDHLP